ncbi:hypothetical protein KSP40_PGU010889 [Platanthera guangdongensis]|uniref:Uncharacterized protein n=1 Tax=Platanthera guangdongensis TaxID=2320717 RepID=A0ABR2MFH7_9ASPA
MHFSAKDRTTVAWMKFVRTAPVVVAGRKTIRRKDRCSPEERRRRKMCARRIGEGERFAARQKKEVLMRQYTSTEDG